MAESNCEVNFIWSDSGGIDSEKDPRLPFLQNTVTTNQPQPNTHQHTTTKPQAQSQPGHSLRSSGEGVKFRPREGCSQQSMLYETSLYVHRAHTNPSINPSTDHWEKRRDDKRKEKGNKSKRSLRMTLPYTSPDHPKSTG